DGDQGPAEGVRHPLGPRESDQERADQPGPCRDADDFHILEGDARLGERAVDDIVDHAEVRPAGELGDDASVELVNVLGEDDMAEDLPFATEHRGRRLVAGGLDPEDDRVPRGHGQSVPLRARSAGRSRRAVSWAAVVTWTMTSTSAGERITSRSVVVSIATPITTEPRRPPSSTGVVTTESIASIACRGPLTRTAGGSTRIGAARSRPGGNSPWVRTVTGTSRVVSRSKVRSTVPGRMSSIRVRDRSPSSWTHPVRSCRTSTESVTSSTGTTTRGRATASRTTSPIGPENMTVAVGGVGSLASIHPGSRSATSIGTSATGTRVG